MTTSQMDPCARCQHTDKMRPHCGEDHPTCTWRNCDTCGVISDRKGRWMNNLARPQ